MFDETSLYFAHDAEVLKLGTYSTLAHWRSEGRGPKYIKVGGKVAYRGSDLNEWLDAQTVDPAKRAA